MKSARILLAAVAAFFLMAGVMAQTPEETKKEQVKLAKLAKEYKAAKAAYTKSPKDAKKKKAYVDSTTVYGYAVMTSPVLGPREKYPQALRLFREALKVDPKNKDAKDGRDLIEGIYKQMGRPIPK